MSDRKEFRENWKFSKHTLPNYNTIGLPSDSINFLYGYLIYFVIYIKAGQIHSVRVDDVYQLVRTAVLAEQHFGVEDLILVQDHLY